MITQVVTTLTLDLDLDGMEVGHVRADVEHEGLPEEVVKRLVEVACRSTLRSLDPAYEALFKDEAKEADG